MDIRNVTGVWELVDHLFKNRWIVNEMHVSENPNIRARARTHADTYTNTKQKSRKERINLNLLKQCDDNICHLVFQSKTPHFAQCGHP
jgi:hypothetical protein